MDTKQLGRVEIKADDKGEFTAVVATYGVVDSDGDVTEKGAHEHGLTVPVSSYGHGSWSGALPVGKATLRVTDTQTIAKGRFFLNTTAGRDTFETVKQLGALGQWSYGYDVVDSEFGERDGDRVRILKRQEIHEVSPVLIGAGVETRTLATKNAQPGKGDTKEGSMDVEYKAAIRPHSTAVTARTWDQAAMLAGLKDDTSVSDMRTVFAYVEPSSDPEVKSSYRFAHHHGVDGPANVRALITHMAVLNGAHGDPGIPEEDRKAIYNHLAHHLKEADREPPELRPAGEGQPTLIEEAIGALAGVDSYLGSAERVVALRAQKGKTLSQVNIEALEWVGEDLRRMLKQHTALLRRLHDTPREVVAEEFVRFLASQR